MLIKVYLKRYMESPDRKTFMKANSEDEGNTFFQKGGKHP
jgi:hypothetical protein